MAVAGIVLMGLGLAGVAMSGLISQQTLLWIAMPVAVIGFAATTPSLQSLLSLSASKTEQGNFRVRSKCLCPGSYLRALSRLPTHRNEHLFALLRFDVAPHVEPVHLPADRLALTGQHR